ncbi:protein unc-93 homolog A-like [Haliotis rufescens]|uniref:protein unc-93 homolog A-like n=1 Tax=Haliotis rufescens TaxID=6454 RepID=UPI00201EF9B3|nr:protein unc-93 homolog A-like [Haliotis rufescens]XP_046333736.2 protein unc-93 homolog A-like [Haliotis rufescens]XP_046333737.2 protein unc-93 homolog A-like [Haliotis rufescens]XP_046333738.2 protein unc-93 homolog A-like [Haliotis rufescens]
MAPTVNSEKTSLIPNSRDAERQTTIRTVRQNLTALCVVWMFTFTAYSGLQNLEASLNLDLGIYSLAAITGSGLITCILAPAIIKFTGCKGALIISWICFCVFVGSNYYPKTYSLIPGSIIIGLGTGLLWTAQGVYVTTSALDYSDVTGEKMDSVVSRFFGIFCIGFQSTQIWGNLISSLVFRDVNNNITIDDVTHCGADDCPVNLPPFSNQTSPVSNKPDDTTVYVLLTIYLGCVVAGLVITVLFLKPIKSRGSERDTGAMTLLTSTLRLLVTDLNMVLLVPFCLYTGMEQVVLFAEYTKSFVTCSLGIDWVGYTMICFGVCNTIGSPIVGWLCRYVGRGVLFLFAAVMNIALIITMLLWHPSPSNKVMFFVVPGLWGMADAVWQTQSAALIGVVFAHKQGPAFGNLRMFQATGFTIAYIYSNQLCQYVKLYLIGAFLVVSLTLVGVVHIRRKNRPNSTYPRAGDET